MKVENKFGFIEIKMPDQKEGIALLRKARELSTEKGSVSTTDRELDFADYVLEKAPEYILSVSMKDGENEIDSCEKLLASAKFIKVTQDAFGSLFKEISGGDSGN